MYTRPSIGMLMLGVCACSSAPPASPPPPVVLVAPAPAAGGAALLLTGRVVSTGFHSIGAQAEGRLATLHADIGDHVSAGQLLADIDPAPARLAVAEARARLEAAAATASERQAQASRAAALVAAGAGAEAAREAAEAAAIAAAADQHAARAALALAQRRLAQTSVRAPIAGRIAARHVERSAVIAAGTRLFDLVADQGMTEILASAPPSHGAWPQHWQVESGAARLPALLIGTGAAVDAAGVLPLRLRLLRGELPPGASVRLVAERPVVGLRAIPASALVAGAGGQQVVRYVGPGDVVREAPARVAGLNGGQAQVHMALPVGARLITAGAAFVEPGQRVRPRLAA